MIFDFLISNPPYQETKGGTKNFDIWPSFVRVVNEVATNSHLVHPGRWVVPKKQMISTRDMIVSSGLRCFDYYPNSAKLFNGVSSDGGVAIVFSHLFAPLEEPSNKEELLLEHLESSYQEEFIINGEAKDNAKGAVWAFSVSPIDNREIEFVAGQKKGIELSSFLLPRFSLVFFDTYSEELMAQTASEDMASEILQPSEQID